MCVPVLPLYLNLIKRNIFATRFFLNICDYTLQQFQDFINHSNILETNCLPGLITSEISKGSIIIP